MSEPDQAAEAVQAAPAASRNDQTCTSCGTVDNLPRHIVIHDFADDSKNKIQHLDCCVADGGCPNHCEPMLASANGATGDELIAHVEARAAEAQAIDNNEGAPAFVESQHAKG